MFSTGLVFVGFVVILGGLYAFVPRTPHDDERYQLTPLLIATNTPITSQLYGIATATTVTVPELPVDIPTEPQVQPPLIQLEPPIEEPPIIPDGSVDSFGISMLNSTIPGGRTWFSKWANGEDRKLHSSYRDPFDPEFIARGNGTISIDGDGIATMSGSAPRMYVYDKAGKKKWNNVEVTVYMKRMSEAGFVSSQGLVVGARSEHQDATLDEPCFGQTYYGRILYDGRSNFQKEVVHEEAYGVTKPNNQGNIVWDTKSGEMPKGVWIGMKYTVKTVEDGSAVELEMYRDMTGGKDGGQWEKVADYIDRGDWGETDSGADVEAICGYDADKIFLDPATSIFIRNDKIDEAQYKWFSIREIGV